MDYSRRELCVLLPALLAARAQAANDQVLSSKVYTFEGLPAKASDGNTFRAILQGVTHEGYHLELHETDLSPGSMPHPPHHHAHEEIFLIREGTLAVTINGEASNFGAGSVAYIASNQEHGIRNVGSTHAQYFVLELGTRD
jgi:mannose-6-phosphate isomerase-like protein (cupin superfamily)